MTDSGVCRRFNDEGSAGGLRRKRGRAARFSIHAAGLVSALSLLGGLAALPACASDPAAHAAVANPAASDSPRVAPSPSGSPHAIGEASAPEESADASAKISPEPSDAASEDAAAAPGKAEPPVSEPRATLSAGEAVNGGLVLVEARLPAGSPASALTAVYESIRLPFYPVPGKKDAYEAVLGVPYEHKPGSSVVSVRYGERTIALPLQVRDGGYPSEKLKVGQRLVTPKKRDLKRIFREQREVRAIYDRVTAKKYWHGKFALPIDSRVTSAFGTRRVYNGELKNFHGGLDLKAAIGTPVHAAAPGRVVMAKFLYYTGYTVLLDHGYGVITLYAHMSRLRVRQGVEVAQGEVLGFSGKTGRVTGPHLHWQALVHRTKINPADLTRLMR